MVVIDHARFAIWVHHQQLARTPDVAGDHGDSTNADVVGAVPHPPCRARMFDRLDDHRPSADIHVAPTRTVVDMRRRSVPRKARFRHGAVEGFPARVHVAPVGRATQDDVDALAGVPCHRWWRPADPGHHRSVRRDRRVEAELMAAIIETPRWAVAVERHHPHFAIIQTHHHNHATGRVVIGAGGVLRLGGALVGCGVRGRFHHDGHHGCPTRSVERREAAARGSASKPQLAVGRDVDDTGSIGEPVETAPTQAATGGRIWSECQRGRGTTADRHGEQLAGASPPPDIADTSAVR